MQNISLNIIPEHQARLDAKFVLEYGALQVPYKRYDQVEPQKRYEKAFHEWCKYYGRI